MNILHTNSARAGVKGTFNPSTRAIGVQDVHNLSYRNRLSTDLNSRIQALLDQIKKLQERIEAMRGR